MTLKDYATIQRHLGYIEGVLLQFDSNVNAGAFDAISVIDGIIDNEWNSLVCKEIDDESN